MTTIVLNHSSKVDKTYKEMTIAELAWTIKEDWRKQGKGVNYAAKPYLDAMMCMTTVKDNIGADSGRSIVAYFLCNASTWKGEVAREVKKELNKRIK